STPDTKGIAHQSSSPQMIYNPLPLHFDPVLLLLMQRPAHRSTLFPYTTLFRSRAKGRYLNPRKIQFWFENLNFGDGTGFMSPDRSPEQTSELQSRRDPVRGVLLVKQRQAAYSPVREK